MKNNTLLYAGLGVGALLFLTKSGSGNPITNLLSPTSTTPGVTPISPTGLIAINSGQLGGNGSYNTVSNYAQLVQANPNLMNPNYLMTAAEQQQYLSNYQDLQTGLPQWVSAHTGGVNTLTDAINRHWRTYGVAEQRVFVPMQPRSGAAYIPPVTPPKPTSSGSNWVSTGLSIATAVIGLLGPNDQLLNNGEVQVLVTGGAVIRDILPMFMSADPLAGAIDQKLTDVLKNYI